MKTLLRFLKPYKLQTFGVLIALGVNLAGVLLVPTILANMINIGVSSRDFGFILNQGGFMPRLAATSATPSTTPRSRSPAVTLRSSAPAR